MAATSPKAHLGAAADAAADVSPVKDDQDPPRETPNARWYVAPARGMHSDYIRPDAEVVAALEPAAVTALTGMVSVPIEVRYVGLGGGTLQEQYIKLLNTPVPGLGKTLLHPLRPLLTPGFLRVLLNTQLGADLLEPVHTASYRVLQLLADPNMAHTYPKEAKLVLEVVERGDWATPGHADRTELVILIRAVETAGRKIPGASAGQLPVDTNGWRVMHTVEADGVTDLHALPRAAQAAFAAACMMADLGNGAIPRCLVLARAPGRGGTSEGASKGCVLPYTAMAAIHLAGGLEAAAKEGTVLVLDTSWECASGTQEVIGNAVALNPALRDRIFCVDLYGVGSSIQHPGCCGINMKRALPLVSKKTLHDGHFLGPVVAMLLIAANWTSSKVAAIDPNDFYVVHSLGTNTTKAAGAQQDGISEDLWRLLNFNLLLLPGKTAAICEGFSGLLDPNSSSTVTWLEAYHTGKIPYTPYELPADNLLDYDEVLLLLHLLEGLPAEHLPSVEPLINTVRGWRTWWDEQDILAEAVRKRYKQFLFQRCKELLRLIPDKIFADDVLEKKAWFHAATKLKVPCALVDGLLVQLKELYTDHNNKELRPRLVEHLSPAARIAWHRMMQEPVLLLKAELTRLLGPMYNGAAAGGLLGVAEAPPLPEAADPAEGMLGVAGAPPLPEAADPAEGAAADGGQEEAPEEPAAADNAATPAAGQGAKRPNTEMSTDTPPEQRSTGDGRTRAEKRQGHDGDAGVRTDLLGEFNDTVQPQEVGAAVVLQGEGGGAGAAAAAHDAPPGAGAGAPGPSPATLLAADVGGIAINQPAMPAQPAVQQAPAVVAAAAVPLPAVQPAPAAVAAAAAHQLSPPLQGAVTATFAAICQAHSQGVREDDDLAEAAAAALQGHGLSDEQVDELKSCVHLAVAEAARQARLIGTNEVGIAAVSQMVGQAVMKL